MSHLSYRLAEPESGPRVPAGVQEARRAVRVQVGDDGAAPGLRRRERRRLPGRPRAGDRERLQPVERAAGGGAAHAPRDDPAAALPGRPARARRTEVEAAPLRTAHQPLQRHRERPHHHHAAGRQ